MSYPYGGYKRPRSEEYSASGPGSNPTYYEPHYQTYAGPTDYPQPHLGLAMPAPVGPGLGSAMGLPGTTFGGPKMEGLAHQRVHTGSVYQGRQHGEGAAAALGTAPDGSMPVVKLRGLPFDTEIEEVNRFLDVETVDVVLMKRGGRFSGEACVVLPGMDQVEFALGKHKHYMGKRYVEVLPCAREDYYRAVSNWIHDPDPIGGYPSSMPSSTPSVNRYAPPPRGRPESVRRGRREGEAGNAGPLPVTGILRLRGLPFTATQVEVANWFNELEDLSTPVEPQKVHLVLQYDGRPTGSAFVEFSGMADAEVAMGRDKAVMGTRYVELFHSSTSEINLVMGGT